jgi:DNA replication licensing factor MCM3
MSDNSDIQSENNNYKLKFRQWLTTQREGNEALREMTANEKDRFPVDLGVLEKVLGVDRQRILDEPHRFLPLLEDALVEAKANDDPSFQKNVKAPVPRIAVTGTFGRHHVTPRGLTSDLLSKLVCIDGIVTRCTNVVPKLVCGVHYCQETTTVVVNEIPEKLGYTTPLELTKGAPKLSPEGHPYTQEVGLSVYRDTQRITIQEMPERAPTGLLPRAVEVILEGGLVNSTKPGERVRVSALYKPLVKLDNGVTSGVVKSILVANHVKRLTKEVNMELDPADLKSIKRVIEREDTLELCARSFAPSICGHDLVKKGLILMLLGGREKILENGTHLRGDIHSLLIGDPSCGKSQMLRFVLNIAPLAVSTTGRGSSGVGLTASVVSDKGSGERRLEAGAMVLADRGVVAIDEFDKMTTQDRTAIHEVMEQQTVTIAKAGMHVQLNARCSVVAAANPLYGSFDDNMDVAKNIHLPDSLLSRFDLIFIVRDLTDPEIDRRIARQVLRQVRYKGPRMSTANGFVNEVVEPEAPTRDSDDPTEVFVRENLYEGKEVLTVDFLRKLIHYCKHRGAKPDLSSAAVQSLAEFYRDLRQKFLLNPKGLPVTTRLLESAIRLATAHAKLKLRPEVVKEDVNVAKRMILESRDDELDEDFALPPDQAEAAAAADAPAQVARLAPREADFNGALSWVLQQEEDGLLEADVTNRVNERLATLGVALFSEEDVRARLELVLRENHVLKIEGKIYAAG